MCLMCRIAALCLVSFLVSGCSITRTYCSLSGNTAMQQPDHVVRLRLSSDNTSKDMGVHLRARAFVIEIQPSANVEILLSSYRYGNSGRVRRLDVNSITGNVAIVVPTEHLVLPPQHRNQFMKEGRYEIDIAYRMNGREYAYRGSVMYKTKREWGVRVLMMGW